jgi:hypothetical protein
MMIRPRAASLDPPQTPVGAVLIGLEAIDKDRTEPRELAVGAAPTLDDEDLEAPTAQELAGPVTEEVEAPTAGELGTDDSVRMYLREIGKVALLTAEEEVVLAKAIELGEQTVEAPGKGIVSLHWE